MTSIISKDEADKLKNMLVDINKSNENLKIVSLEIPDGGLCMGTKVRLSNGQYLTGITSIKLECSVEQPVWMIQLEIRPKFKDQETIQALLKDIKVTDETTKLTTSTEDCET